MPLLAVAAELKKLDPAVEFLLVGTSDGPARQMAQQAGIDFAAIPAAKFRRYFSWRNAADVFVFLYSLLAAWRVVKRFRPDLVFGAGGFVAVPVSWVARLQKVTVVMHQQDVNPGLANKLIRPVAKLITTAFESTAKMFVSGSGIEPAKVKPQAEWVGNPVRPEFLQPVDPAVRGRLGLTDSLPVVLVVGGATGANQINQVVAAAVPQLAATHQIIHITGAGKHVPPVSHANYHKFEFLGADFPAALKLADVVVTRAGISTVAELSATGKVAIVVPMPNTHQEDNAEALRVKQAAVIMRAPDFTPDKLIATIRQLQFDVDQQRTLSQNISKIMPHDAASKLARLLYDHTK